MIRHAKHGTVGLGMLLLVALATGPPAFANDTTAKPDCTGLTVQSVKYPKGGNTVTVVIDDVTTGPTSFSVHLRTATVRLVGVHVACVECQDSHNEWSV